MQNAEFTMQNEGIRRSRMILISRLWRHLNYGFSIMHYAFLNIKIDHILGVFFDPCLSGLDFFTHEDGEDLVGGCGIL